MTRASAFLLMTALALGGCGTEAPSVPTVPMPSTAPPPTPPPTQPLPIEGSYYLTTIIDPSCADRFPRDVRRREYAITVRRAEGLSYFDFASPGIVIPGLPGAFSFPSGSVAANGDIHALITLFEQRAGSSLDFNWSAENTLGYSAPDRAIGGLIGGLVAYQDPDYPRVECQSAHHQIALTPR